MNFFVNQEYARKQTRKLVFLFLVTTVLTCILTSFFVSVVYTLNDTESYHQLNFWNQRFIDAYSISFVVTFIIVVSVSLEKMRSLKNPGFYVVSLLNAKYVESNNKDPLKKRFRNIVEEMSLACGIPTPQVYVLEDESSINAFAAGYEINDAVIGVTMGSLKHLNRDQLQAVVAHEFGHIFNGDMKINIRLIGCLAGLSSIYYLGDFFLNDRSKDRRRNPGLVFICLGLMAIGGLGMFFASWIKSSISKQREFLADASSVQFTRNPEGLLGALKKFASIATYSSIDNANVGELSHIFFGDSGHRNLFKFNTHPDVYERIRVVDSKFNQRQFEQIEMPNLIKELSKKDEVVETENIPKTNKINVIPQLPEKDGELVLVFALMIKRGNEQTKHFEYIYNQFGEKFKQETELMVNQLKKIENKSDLEIMNSIISDLKHLSTVSKKNFLLKLKNFVAVDSKISKEEFILYSYLRSILTPNTFFSGNKFKKSELIHEVTVLFSFLARHDIEENNINKEAFELGFRHVFSDKISVLSLDNIKYSMIENAFKKISFTDPMTKKLLLEGANLIINSNDVISNHKKELISLFSQSIGVPTIALNSF